jgi:PKD repeat protein
MKLFRYIILFLLICGTTHVFSQNKRNNSVLPSPLNLPPEPHFSWINSCLGDTACFINQSIRAYSYTWTITGDSITAHGGHIPLTLYKSYNDSIMCYHFNKGGTYSVTLTCYDNHLDSVTNTITIDTVTQANFSYIHCSNNFENNSLCAASFYWDFGDGTNSTLHTPNHHYADTGYYNVTLIAYKGVISDTRSQQIFVDVTSFANAGFTDSLSHDTLFVHSTYVGHPSPGFNWGFGDGDFATGADTFHVYKDSTAFYDVELVAINSCGPSFNDDTVKITQLNMPPKPNFYFLNTCLGDTTCFINQTIGTGATSYTWTVSSTTSSPQILFTSTDSNACFRFPSTGSYSITLKALRNTYAEINTQLIIIGTVPIAGFSFMHCSNNFLNNSGCAKSFYWNFGDGNYSTAIVPIHQYADTGWYHVTLIAYNGIDSDTLTQKIHVDVTSYANANFTAISLTDTLKVHATYDGVPIASYNWSFGDGVHAGGRDTTHVYSYAIASYYVKLEVSNLCGSVSETDTLKITIPLPPSNLDFSSSVLTIVPNPASNNSYIDAFYNSYNSDDYEVQIYNILGQEMFEEYFAFQSGINEFKINAVNFSAGVYIMVLQSGNSYIRKKFYVINTP